MSTQETPATDPSRRKESVALSEEMDAEWCTMFMEAYCSGQFRSVLYSSYFYAGQDQRNHQNPQPVKYERVMLGFNEEDMKLIDGRVVGVKIMPMACWDENYDIYTEYVPHLAMSDVTLLSDDGARETTSLADGPYERVYVPVLPLKETLCLYPAET